MSSTTFLVIVSKLCSSILLWLMFCSAISRIKFKPSLEANRLVDSVRLADAIAFARARDNATILAQRSESGEHSAQTTISAVAAVVIRLGPSAGADYDWAWDVMGRVA